MSEQVLSNHVDVERLQHALEDFSEATGVATVAVDARGLPVTPPCAFTKFCQTVRANPEGNRLCHGCDAHGGLQSMLTGGPSIYRCHAGVVDFSTPFVVDDSYVGAILGGQVRVKGEEQPGYLTGRASWAQDERLHDFYENIPVVSRRRVEAVAEMMHNLRSAMLNRPAGTQLLPDRGPVSQAHTHTVEAKHSLPESAPLLAAMDAEDLGSAFGLVCEMLDETYRGLNDVGAGVEHAEDSVLVVARDLTPRLVPHLTSLVRAQRIPRAASPGRYHVQLRIERLLVMILDEIVRSRPRQGRELQDLLNDIVRHPHLPISLTQAAASVHWSPGHLSKRLKSVTGYTFVAYVTAWRMMRAELMLASTQMPVRRVSQAVGFTRVSYFSRVFRSHTGLSPSEYRRRSSSRSGRSSDESVPAHHHLVLRR
ncbi:MAG: PocR ligand-binding domain-containing protein [Arachnia sp.]